MENKATLVESLYQPTTTEPCESIRPTCIGCGKELSWIDEGNPRCACGQLLCAPVPELERI
jgi:hypothetical protein